MSHQMRKKGIRIEAEAVLEHDDSRIAVLSRFSSAEH